MYREKIRDLFQLLFNNTTTRRKNFYKRTKDKKLKKRELLFMTGKQDCH